MIVIIISSVHLSFFFFFFFFFFPGRWTHCFLPSSDHVNAKIKLTIMKSLEQ